MIDLRVYRIITCTAMAGPGLRYCIWTQGCSRHCEGCMATETWSFEGGTQIDADDLTADILSVVNRGDTGIEGITFLGGEPFEQAAAAARIAASVKEHNLSVVVFTGFSIDELQKSTDESTSLLLKSIDMLVDGPFIKELFDISRPWVGSSNQKYHFLTDRYNTESIMAFHNQIEIRISPDGKSLVNGMGDFRKIKNLL